MPLVGISMESYWDVVDCIEVPYCHAFADGKARKYVAASNNNRNSFLLGISISTRPNGYGNTSIVPLISNPLPSHSERGAKMNVYVPGVTSTSLDMGSFFASHLR